MHRDRLQGLGTYNTEIRAIPDATSYNLMYINLGSVDD